MKTLFWDIETAPLVSSHWGLFNQNIMYDDILQDWYMISAAWKWAHERKVHTVSVLDGSSLNDDSVIVDRLHDVLMEADILVAHNGDKFDLKKFNARSILYRKDPLPHIPSVDTLRIARSQFKFTSNRLDYLGDYLGVGRKVTTPKGLWKQALHVPDFKKGSKKAVKTMVNYNKGDITLLEDVYYALRPYDRQHPNWNHNYGDKVHVCPNCGSHDLQKRGVYRTRITTRQRFQCNSCKAWSSSGKMLEKNEIR